MIDPTLPDHRGKAGYWIFTLQMSMWRFARDLNIPYYDITVKTGNKLFAPTWEDLIAYRNGEISNEEYSRRYYAKVVPTIRTHPQEWNKMAEHKTFAFACFCKPGNFCHRYLFAMLYIDYLKSHGATVEFMGELWPHPNNLKYYVKNVDEKQRGYNHGNDARRYGGS